LKINFNSTALGILKEKLELEHLANPQTDQGPIGRSPERWAMNIDTQFGSLNLPKEKISRLQLLEYCKATQGADKPNPTLACLLAIGAWGSMKTSHGRDFFLRPEMHRSVEVLEALDDLRTSGASRKDAFQSLKDLHSKGLMPGVGIAYYTKFLFFLRPQPDAYILDQWTAKSINYLMAEPVIKLTGDGYVHPGNSADTYDHFCTLIDALRHELRLDTGAMAEEKIFSRGGRTPLAWRWHIKSNFHVIEP
jgi:hypothetical protein